jgi:hypothetical protein
MRAIPVVPNRLITVVAKSAETFRVGVLSQPTEKIATATQQLSHPVAAAVDVVNAEKLVSGLAATSACLAVVLDSYASQPLMPFTSVGVALFLVEMLPAPPGCPLPLSPVGVVLVPLEIPSRIFSAAFRVFSSALAAGIRCDRTLAAHRPQDLLLMIRGRQRPGAAVVIPIRKHCGSLFTVVAARLHAATFVSEPRLAGCSDFGTYQSPRRRHRLLLSY